MAYKITDYHRSLVVHYYMALLIRFGPTLLLRHLPQFKKIVWVEGGVALIEVHKKKRANQEWSA